MYAVDNAHPSITDYRIDKLFLVRYRIFLLPTVGPSLIQMRASQHRHSMWMLQTTKDYINQSGDPRKKV
jgi:hypothetical protein